MARCRDRVAGGGVGHCAGCAYGGVLGAAEWHSRLLPGLLPVLGMVYLEHGISCCLQALGLGRRVKIERGVGGERGEQSALDGGGLAVLCDTIPLRH